MPLLPRSFVPALVRSPLRGLTFARILRGGRLADAGRLPRYLGLFAIGAVCIWTPITTYLSTAPLRYTSGLSLILPGSGASASVNLDRIGQASSFASSPYAHSSVSPTETYKRLLAAERILDAAADSMAMPTRTFGQPRIELVDQTGLIHVSITGTSPEDAKARGDALLSAFFSEVEALRTDELNMRETGAGEAIGDYREAVLATRSEISRLQRETGLISAAQFEALVAENDTLALRVQDMSATLADKSEAVATLTAALRTTPRLASAALKLHADTAFTALVEEMSDQAALLSRKSSKFGENHPEVRAARDGHATAQSAALARARAITGLGHDALAALDISHVGNRAALLSDLVTLDAERAGLAAELAETDARLRAARTRQMALIDPAARLEDLQRDFAVAEAVFASAIARTQTNKADLFASYPLVQVLEDPSLPTDPSSPRRKLAMAAGVAATIFMLIGFSLGWMRRPLIDRLITPAHASEAQMVPAE
ncbi:GumC family protein [Pseudooceanicola sp. LIPI14-2-Ac024]|uniref:GumC family protein n=1 Tax=Pseudooceanicola sp. LIPI14-2-Ac024 TaxID=3344875 RepID=UPI0035CE8858